MTYADNDGKYGSTELMTDGLASPDDGAECILLKKGGGAYFTVDLGQEFPVRDVQVVGKPGKHNLPRNFKLFNIYHKYFF